MSNQFRVFPRAQLKAEAKQLMRPNWKSILLVTLIYIIFLGVDSYAYTNYVPGTDPTTGGVTASYSVSGAAGIYTTYFNGDISTGHMLMISMIALISAILVQGVLKYCYTAFFVKMSERKGETIGFGTFVEGFNDAIKAILAFLWQYLWSWIWGMAAVPGLILLFIGAFGVGTFGDFTFVFAGIILMVIGIVVCIMATLRYVFMYQVIADGRGKVGARQAMRISIGILKGHLADIFILPLSFIPWMILGTVTLGLGFFYALPYMEATYALSYRWMRDEAFREGRVDPADLGYVQMNTAPTAPQAPAEAVPVQAAPVVAEDVTPAEAVGSEDAPVSDASVSEEPPVEARPVEEMPADEAGKKEEGE